MKEAATIAFKELETFDEGLAIIRYDDASVAICLSARKAGDIEVVIAKADARAIIEALRIAVGEA